MPDSNFKYTNRRFILICVLLVVVMWTTVSCAALKPTKELPPTVVKVEAEYVVMPQNEMIAEADAIVLGVVTSIAESRWNQADGTYWEDVTFEGKNKETLHTALLFHEVELTILEPLLDKIGLPPDKIIITELGKSPLEEKNVVIDGVEYENEGYTLAPGDEVIVFLEQGEMAFRDPDKPISLQQAEDGETYFDSGSRGIVGFLVKPDESFYIKGEDGLYYSPASKEQPISLEILVQEIAAIRDLAPGEEK